MVYSRPTKDRVPVKCRPECMGRCVAQGEATLSSEREHASNLNIRIGNWPESRRRKGR